jgi:two-component system, chemotaxis family, response regulator Rcp1
MKTWHVLASAHCGPTPRVHATNWTTHPEAEDLEQLALDKTLAEDRVKIEVHLHECDACRDSFEEARVVADRLKELLHSQGRQDQRKSVRYKVRESAIVTRCNPPDFVPLIGQVLDASTTGLRLRIPSAVHRGTQVQVQVEKAVVFGTIRYCQEVSRNACDVGLVIDQVVIRPLAPPVESADADAEAGPKKPRSKAPVEVLLVEDNPADAKLVKFIFQSIEVPHHLTIVGDGAQALGRLLDPEIPKPTVVLLDLNLPKLSGLEVLRRMRADRTTQSVNVVVFSSSLADADVRRTTALGIRAYLPKPDNITHLEDMRRSLNDLVADVAS